MNGEQNKDKVTKVIFEYQDSSKRYLDGEDLDKWLEMINGAIVMQAIHEGSNWVDIKWKEIEK